jgi:hypothetical protein
MWQFLAGSFGRTTCFSVTGRAAFSGVTGSMWRSLLQKPFFVSAINRFWVSATVANTIHMIQKICCFWYRLLPTDTPNVFKKNRTQI